MIKFHIPILLLFLLLCNHSYGFQQQRIVSGIVSDGDQPLEGAHVQIEGTNTVSVTDAKGRYEIEVATGDNLLFTFTGFEPRKIFVEDVTQRLDIVLNPAFNELDEVTVTGTQRQKSRDLEKEYFTNKSIIRTSFGYLDQRSAGGSFRVLDGSEISAVNICILNVLRNRFPGVRVQGDCQQGGSVIIRGAGSINLATSAIFDVDGQIYTDPPIWIDVGNIRRIAVLSSLGMTSSYGNLGNNGVVVINTDAAMGNRTARIQRLQSMQNGQIYADDALSAEDLFNDLPTYMQHIATAPNEREAKARFETHYASYGDDPYFLLNVFEAFKDHWPESGFANELIASHDAAFAGNPVVLKALAFQYEAKGDRQRAIDTYIQVFKLRPRHPQSYLDLARSYTRNGQSDKSSSLLLRLANALQQNEISIDSLFYESYLDRELIAMQASNDRIILNEALFEDLILENQTNLGSKRVVLEWNNSDAEFIVQFVNPSGQIYEWAHTLDAEGAFIYSEKTMGFTSRDFFLDAQLPGRWLINIKYLGNKSQTPTFFKATRIDAYGQQTQSERSAFLTTRIKGLNHAFMAIDN
jgi:tetratricopeptide (TPR) repeat protein